MENRIIKFRFWRLDTEDMLILDESEEDIFTISTFKDKNYICMQFTGLKDKNGKEIFEGDILDDKDRNLPLIVYFNVKKGAWFMKSVFSSDNEDDFIDFYDLNVLEIIGNKFENPELLK